MAVTAPFGYPFWVQGPDDNNLMAGGIGDTAYVEAASQVYKALSPVFRDTGTVKVAVVSSNLIAAKGIAGLAQLDATGVTGTPAPIVRFRAGDFWAMNYCVDGTRTATALALIDTFVNFDVVNPSTGIYYLVANSDSVDLAKPGGYIRKLWTADQGYLQSPYVLADVGAPVIVEIASAGGIV